MTSQILSTTLNYLLFDYRKKRQNLKNNGNIFHKDAYDFLNNFCIIVICIVVYLQIFFKQLDNKNQMLRRLPATKCIQKT